MKKYELEPIEWTNIWREEANDNCKPRILLIGDSITVGYSSHVYQALEKKFGVTRFSTSKCLDNPFLLEEIILLGKQEKYDYVHFNNGIHGGSIKDDEIYRTLFQKAVSTLRETFPLAKLSIATSTVLCEVKNGEITFTEYNETILSRNEIVREVAKANNIPVDDLYEVAVHNLQYLSSDGVHYTDEGYALLGKTVANFLMQL